MSWLALDVGNSHTVVGVMDHGGSAILKTWRLSTHPQVTSDEFRIKLEALLASEKLSLSEMKDVVVSSVVPPATSVIRKSFVGTGVECRVIDSTWPFSFQISASPASSVGADRLVNAEAVVREFGSPAIVVDSGTATTLCAIAKSPSGPVYMGGAIMTGIELSIQALARNTAQLFAVELVPPARAVGGNTADALKSGILFGYAEMIDGMVRRFKEEMGTPHAPVIATGGVSTLLKGITRELTHHDPDLTLKGIAALYESIRSR